MSNVFLEGGPKNPIKIQDNTFRDGHQSTLATRMRTEDMLPIAERMDQIEGDMTIESIGAVVLGRRAAAGAVGLRGFL